MGISGDFLQVLKFLFVDVWKLFISWTIPGTNITPAEWAIFSLVIVRMIKIIRVLFGVYQGVEEDNSRG